MFFLCCFYKSHNFCQNLNDHSCFILLKFSCLYFQNICVLSGLVRIRDFEADVVRRKSCATSPAGQDLGMASGCGLSPDRSSAIKSHSPPSEDCAVLHPQVSCLLERSLLLGICLSKISSYSVACPFTLLVVSLMKRSF